MKKQTLLSLAIALLVLTVVVGVVFSCSEVAWAEVVTPVYPTEGYIQAKRVDLVAVSESYVLTYDDEIKVLSVTGKKYGTVDLSASAPNWLEDDTVTKMFVFGDCAIVRATKDYTVNLESLAVEETILFAECYLTAYSDKLYAHSWGKVDVYDDTLSIVATYENNAFKNKPIMVADGQRIFSFAVDYGVNKLYVYDVESNTAEESNSIFVENAVIGESIVAYDGEKIIVIDKYSYDVSVTDVGIECYAVLGDKLYLARGKDGYDVYKISDDGLTFESNFSYGGDGLDKLNSPTAGVAFGDEIVVTDTGADRLLFVGENTLSLAINHPTLIASERDRIYVKSSEGLVIVEDKAVKSIVETEVEIRDMLYTDRLYVLADDGVYTLISGALIKVFDVEGGLMFAYNELFYVVKEASVEACYLDGTTNDLLHIDLDGFNQSKPLDVLVNGYGDVFILFDDDKLIRFDWVIVSKNNTGELDGLLCSFETFESADYQYTAKSMFVCGDRLVVVTNENAIVSITNSISPGVVDVKPDLTGLTPALYMTGATTYIKTERYDGSTSRFVEAGKAVLAYEVDGKLYAKLDGVEGWIDNLVEATVTAVSGSYRTKAETRIYLNPEYDEYVILPARTKVSLLDNGAGYGNGEWWRVSYMEKTYFVRRDALEEVPTVGPIIPPVNDDDVEEVKADYGRAKASRAGELVPLYSSVGGDVATSVKDGTRLEIIEKVGDYYKVKFDGGEYFVHKDQFKLDGLTTVQTIAIVLSVVVVLAGGLVFAVTSLTRKKEENR